MIAAIGDIHGCFFTLVDLIDLIRKEYPNVKIYSVGDLVDRGKNSYEVLKFIIQENIEFTAGNHDYMFYHFFKKPSSIFARSWSFNGSDATLKSYEKHEDELFKHIDRIKAAPLMLNLDECFLSHAGISAYYKKRFSADFKKDLNLLKDFVEQDYYDDFGVMWNRSQLLDLGKLQLVGHTRQEDVRLDEKANAAYIDTGAFVGKKLSAVIVENSKIVETFSVKTNLNDIV